MLVQTLLENPFADAAFMLTFVHRWAARERAAAASSRRSPPLPGPVFDPAALDALDTHAAGDIDSAPAGTGFTVAVRSLPFHGFS